MSFTAHLRAFVEDPKGVAALTPTSSFALTGIASKVASRQAKLIVEYGPGSGVLTRRLLERLHPEGKLIAIELHDGLATRLRESVRDPRLTVVQGSAQSIEKHLDRLELTSPVEYALSGMPFFWLPSEVAQEIVGATHKTLAPGGKFIAYQMFFLGRKYLRTHLETYFPSVTAEFELRNLPPYRIYEAIK